VQVLVHSHGRRERRPPIWILVHGLEGSSDAGYAPIMAQAALEAGFRAHRYNMRSCGGTEHLSGKTHIIRVRPAICCVSSGKHKGQAPVFLAGFSLGGNVVLKLPRTRRSSERLDCGVSAISAPIDWRLLKRLDHGELYLFHRFVSV